MGLVRRRALTRHGRGPPVQGLTGRNVLPLLRSFAERHRGELAEAAWFAQFYRFVFLVARTPGQRNLAVDSALAAWSICLDRRFPLLERFCAFVRCHRRHVVTEDTWMQVRAPPSNPCVGRCACAGSTPSDGIQRVANALSGLKNPTAPLEQLHSGGLCDGTREVRRRSALSTARPTQHHLPPHQPPTIPTLQRASWPALSALGGCVSVNERAGAAAQCVNCIPPGAGPKPWIQVATRLEPDVCVCVCVCVGDR
jgi:hypothetical protein